MRVPFVGWTLAAERFRAVAAENAKKNLSVLIIGEQGVGKRTMAKVWRYVAGATEKRLPTVNLDGQPDELPARCIAVSTRPPESGRRRSRGQRVPPRSREAEPLHLDSGKFEPVPKDECKGKLLDNGLASRFKIRLYMPPLRRRLLDILAVLHFFGQRRTRSGCTQISSALIHRLLLDSSWLGNVASLVEYLRAATAERPAVLADDPYDQLDVSGEEREQAQSAGAARHFLREYVRPAHLRHQRVHWTCEDVTVPFERLPVVGLSILLARLWLSLDDPDQPALRLTWTPQPQHPLGRDDWWPSHPAWDTIPDLAKASAEQLLAAYTGQPAERGFPREVLTSLAEFQTFGASLRSIQGGIRITSGNLSEDLYQDWAADAGSPRKPTKPRRKLQRLRSTKLSKRQVQAYQLVVIDRLSLAAAAFKMGCTPQNVSLLVNKARTKLKAANSRSRSVEADWSLIENKDTDSEDDGDDD